jgi:hypothetical protein
MANAVKGRYQIAQRIGPGGNPSAVVAKACCSAMEAPCHSHDDRSTNETPAVDARFAGLAVLYALMQMSRPLLVVTLSILAGQKSENEQWDVSPDTISPRGPLCTRAVRLDTGRVRKEESPSHRVCTDDAREIPEVFPMAVGHGHLGKILFIDRELAEVACGFIRRLDVSQPGLLTMGA